MKISRESAAAFSQAYDDHVWDVFGFLGYRVRTREEVEDLTQATFERALGAWNRFDPERGSARTWLLAIARNLLIDHYRHKGAADEVPLPDVGDSGAGALHASVPASPEPGPSPEIEQALASLAERDREVIALRFGGDLTGPEIAEMTGLSLANVQQIISRSLRRLRSELEGD